jgi:erythromycin esterase-like protein
MWANKEIVDLVEWLRLHNLEAEKKEKQVRFYGLDVYSLWESHDAVMKYLQRYYPDAVKAAMRAYKCFEPYGRDVQEYVKATLFVPESCEHKVMDMLIELRQEARTADENRKKDDGEETEAYFNAE